MLRKERQKLVYKKASGWVGQGRRGLLTENTSGNFMWRVDAFMNSKGRVYVYIFRKGCHVLQVWPYIVPLCSFASPFVSCLPIDIISRPTCHFITHAGRDPEYNWLSTFGVWQSVIPPSHISTAVPLTCPLLHSSPLQTNYYFPLSAWPQPVSINLPRNEITNDGSVIIVNALTVLSKSFFLNFGAFVLSCLEWRACHVHSIKTNLYAIKSCLMIKHRPFARSLYIFEISEEALLYRYCEHLRLVSVRSDM